MACELTKVLNCTRMMESDVRDTKDHEINPLLGLSHHNQALQRLMYPISSRIKLLCYCSHCGLPRSLMIGLSYLEKEADNHKLRKLHNDHNQFTQ